MRKNFLLLVMILLTVKVMNAQPQLTIANMMQIGDTTLMIRFDTTGKINEGPGGTDVIWDYSDLDSVNHYHRYSLDPPSTPYGNHYPTANFCERSIIDASDFYGYAIFNSDSVTQVGAAGVSGDSTVYYEPITSHYPVTYLSTQVDTSIYTMFMHNGLQLRIHERQTIIYDGYGTLKIPVGTFTNVVRHSLETYIIDSMYMNTTFMGVDTFYEKNYYWVAENYRPELLRMLVIQLQNGVPKTSAIPYYYNKTPHLNLPTSVVKTSNNNSFAYPNPFSETTTVYLNSSIRDGNACCKIYNVLGEEVQNISNINTNEIKIERNNLPAGIYFYKISDKNKITGIGKLIVQ
ncbi:MAG: T9SS type A sorting domain-containing protein [Bacteroidales bacterium]|nr:T9SS type A sorting domain-containing protein [Bacteroidales bacterium]